MDLNSILKETDPLALGRRELAELMVRKHEYFSVQYKKESEDFSRKKSALEREKKEAKDKRDKRNKKVQSLKSSRNALSKKAKGLRERFFQLLKERPLPDEEKKKLRMYKGQLSNVEWKLETEGIDLDTEKRLMKEARLCFQEIENINTAIKEEGDRKIELQELSRDISGAMNESRKLHEEMVRLVDEADRYHDEWLKKRRDLKERASDVERKGRWISKHDEAAGYWKQFLDRLPEEKEEVQPSTDLKETQSDASGDKGKPEKKMGEEKERSGEKPERPVFVKKEHREEAVQVEKKTPEKVETVEADVDTETRNDDKADVRTDEKGETEKEGPVKTDVRTDEKGEMEKEGPVKTDVRADEKGEAEKKTPEKAEIVKADVDTETRNDDEADVAKDTKEQVDVDPEARTEEEKADEHLPELVELLPVAGREKAKNDKGREKVDEENSDREKGQQDSAGGV